jgi:hypothetical protein
VKQAWWRAKSASEKATLVARVISHVALGVLLLRAYTTSVTVVNIGSAALGASALALVVALVLASRTANGMVRPLYAGLSLAALGGVLSQLYVIVAYVLPGRTPPMPNPSLWLLVVGVNPVLAGTFAVAIGRRRRQALRLPELLDVILVATAAAIVALLIAELSPEPVSIVSSAARTMMLVWRSGMIATIALAALLLATRGDAIGTRAAAMLVSGTALLEVAHAIVAREAMTVGRVDPTRADIWWAAAVAVFTLALPARLTSREVFAAVFPGLAEHDDATSDATAGSAIDGLRARTVIGAIIVTSGVAGILGVSGRSNLLLSAGVALFGVVLAVRAAMVLEAERKARVIPSLPATSSPNASCRRGSRPRSRSEPPSSRKHSACCSGCGRSGSRSPSSSILRACSTASSRPSWTSSAPTAARWR